MSDHKDTIVAEAFIHDIKVTAAGLAGTPCHYCGTREWASQAHQGQLLVHPGQQHCYIVLSAVLGD